MPDRRVTRVALDDDGAVSAVGGDFGVRSRASAIIDIQNGAHTYHIDVDGRRLEVVVVSAEDRRHLRTSEELNAADRLADLPRIS